ncbi:hypothetical protein [Xanthomonas arboricola]|uniref:hypothetical protein n=1 Tax=Xanthomonas arboricola TaxID=56448 RepID=UPI00201A02F3|nr:hypothetical protein [Xanthomonas arboricola]MDN0208722.1 hypothetical protein [Xanthomonas arboricola pv. corylina]MDN0213160.1 hypothetical protein [Xanthomonas arboricola pv. corylina]UQQ10386.1 hypothetical protein KP021_20215 [Xanthomonas arboricola pv. corylina]UQQ15529.1 hypothetical protein KPG65_03325 [Xanthomonas arboricola pv. corylina]
MLISPARKLKLPERVLPELRYRIAFTHCHKYRCWAPDKAQSRVAILQGLTAPQKKRAANGVMLFT